MRNVLCLICLSVYGLLENEVNDILMYLEEHKGITSQCSFSRLYESLTGFLASGGGGYLRLFHDQLYQVVYRKFRTVAFEIEVNTWLADFYLYNIEPQLCEHPKDEPPSYYPHCIQVIVDHGLRIMELGVRVL